MSLHPFTLEQIPAAPWKNGGGVTREIVVHPAGADMTRFDWRVSVATIDADGPFSAFPGVDRTIMLISGGGVRLQSQAAPLIDHRLDEPLKPFAFPGEAPIMSTLVGGSCSDLNLMVQRTRGSGSLTVHRGPATIAADGGMVFAVDGQVTVLAGDERHVLADGQGVWWDETTDLRGQPDSEAVLVVAQWHRAT